MSHSETHSACDARLQSEGGKAQCCYCKPHEGCMIGKTRLVSVAGEFASLRLMRQISYEKRRINEPLPSPRQVAMVLHALADHTAIMSALQYRPDPISIWPQATSIGRWLHDVGNDLEDINEGATQ